MIHPVTAPSLISASRRASGRAWVQDLAAQASCRLGTQLLQRPLLVLWGEVSRRASPHIAATYCCGDQRKLGWPSSSA
eukprot:2873273-Pyramimonas_sp.AAC.2